MATKGKFEELVPYFATQDEVNGGFEDFIDNIDQKHVLIGALVVKQPDTQATIGRGFLNRHLTWKKQENDIIFNGCYELNAVESDETMTIQDWVKIERQVEINRFWLNWQ